MNAEQIRHAIDKLQEISSGRGYTRCEARFMWPAYFREDEGGIYLRVYEGGNELASKIIHFDADREAWAFAEAQAWMRALPTPAEAERERFFRDLSALLERVDDLDLDPDAKELMREPLRAVFDTISTNLLEHSK